MTNLIRIYDLTDKYWNKETYNVMLPPENNPYGNKNGVVTFRFKKKSSYCYSYLSNLTMIPRRKYTCTLWVKTDDPAFRVQMYTGHNKQKGRVWGKPILAPINNWVKLTWHFVNPAGSKAYCVSFRLRGNNNSRYRSHSLYNPVIVPFGTEINEENKTEENKTEENKTETKLVSTDNLSNVFSVIYERYIDTVVNIMVDAKDGNTYRGTGFFISNDGYIATAGHVVVAGNTTPEPFVKKVYVTIYPENILLEGKVVGVDRLYDVGVIKIDIPGNAVRDYLQWYNSRDVKIGSYAVTIGHPLGHHVQSITSGIVSENKGQDYSWMPESLIVDFSIIGGNSGGPVINKEGKAIGIVSWGYDVGNFSLNGSIGSYVAKKVVDNLILRHKNGETSPMIFKTGYMGIYFRPIGMYETVNLGLNSIQGMQVISVASGSPAKTAGLKANDVILKANDKLVGKFNNQELLGSIIHFTPIGQTIRLVVKRGSLTLNINVPVIQIPPSKDYIFANTQTIQKLMKKEFVMHC